ncbi:HET-domain-containing protein [Acephala macrosclerotiorum]|nr:HET-domain-containing protein [Acephala macrosclerotiorum]
MRLLDARTRQLREFMGDENAPRYAILSHTWGEDEITFQGLNQRNAKRKAGYTKIEYSCVQALKDGLDWVWIDTCCIDKSSSAELSEAINSMFRWYQKAVICYVYLSDYSRDNIPADGPAEEFGQCRWFTRGWTLQELLAPKTIIFYSKTWVNLGTKHGLCSMLSNITGIESETLKSEPLNRVSIARRMSWAAKRTTTRTEDLAYCLLGIFDVNMPLLYGEGEKAFFRLQEEIIKSSSDQSIFAWGDSPIITMDSYFEEADMPRPYSGIARDPLHGLLAESPLDFKNSGIVDSLNQWELQRRGWEPKPITIHNRIVYIDLPIVKVTIKLVGSENPEVEVACAALGCRRRDRYAIDTANYIGLPLKALNNGMFVRSQDNKLILIPKVPYLNGIAVVKPKVQHLSLAISSRIRRDFAFLEQYSARYFLRPEIPSLGSGLYLSHVHCSPLTNYDKQGGMIWSDQSFDCLAACLYFRFNIGAPPFAVVISGSSLRHTSLEYSGTLDIIYVYAKVLPEDYDSIQDSTSSFFDDVQTDNSGWDRLSEPDISCSPKDRRKAPGRQMKLLVSDKIEVVITAQWYDWQGWWHEDLTIEVLETAPTRSCKPANKIYEQENYLKRRSEGSQDAQRKRNNLG